MLWLAYLLRVSTPFRPKNNNIIRVSLIVTGQGYG